MDLLIVSQSAGLKNQIRLHRGWLGAVFAIFVSVLGLAGYWGYNLGLHHGFAQEPGVLRLEIQQQRDFLNELKKDMDADLVAFSASAARLHGYLSRLDAVAERVAQSSRLDPAEFSFGDPTPRGGPIEGTVDRLEWAGLLADITALEEEIDLRHGKLTLLESFLAEKQLQEAVEPIGKPVRNGWISSTYGYRIHPISGRREFHNGIDFAGKANTFVRAVASGVVTWSGSRWGYGNMVEINHGSGYLTRYAHNKENLAALGQKVTKGEAIALLGSTGMSTGPHVHFEVIYKDKPVDPKKFIEKHN